MSAMRRRLLAASVLLALPVAPARAAISLAPHRAVYDLTLSGAAGGTVAASGRMVFEVRDACSAWATQQMLTIDQVDRDGTRVATRSDYATFEAKDGASLSFTMTQRNDGDVASAIRGRATIAADGDGRVRFVSPAGARLVLPRGTLFPMMHTKVILEAAEAGRRALSPLLFDGTGTDGAEYTHAELLGWGATRTAAAPALAHLASGRFAIAFFPLESHDMSPEYQIAMRYFANGVSDQLDMDFGDFRLHGTLESLRMLPWSKDCRR